MGYLKNTKINLDALDVMDRYGISKSTLRRWTQDVELEMPASFKVSGKRFWRTNELDAWDESRAGRSLQGIETVRGAKVISPIIRDYGEFVSAMRERRDDMKMTNMELEAKSGLQEGYVTKLENWPSQYARGIGADTFPLWLGGLRVGVVLVELPRRSVRKQRAD